MAYSLYSQKQQLQTEGMTLARQFTAITSVDQVNMYNGKESFLVVEGKTDQNIPIIAWFKDQQLVRYEYRNSLKSEEGLEENIKQKIAVAGKIEAIPGMEDKTPLWEIRFTDQEGKLNYYYYNMKSGDFIRSYRLQKMEG